MQAHLPWMLFGSLSMVFGQCMVAMSAIVGTIEPSCESSDQCRRGGWCQVAQRRCRYCGGGGPLPFQVDLRTGASYNDIRDDAFAGYNETFAGILCSAPTEVRTVYGELFSADVVTSWCDACLHATTGTVDPLTEGSLATMNIRGMGLFDWIALIFATAVVAFVAVGELTDIHLCDLATQRAGDNLTTRWRLAFQFIGFLRRFTFLPSLVTLVPMLIGFQGGDALSVSAHSLMFCSLSRILIVELEHCKRRAKKI